MNKEDMAILTTRLESIVNTLNKIQEEQDQFEERVATDLGYLKNKLPRMDLKVNKLQGTPDQEGKSPEIPTNTREELTAILDQFNIQVDNPVAILNQDTSRNFLNSKSPQDRYKTGKPLYHEPVYITENRNGDIVVSDIGKGVVVTDRDGKYRFTYTGPPEGLSLFMPCGACVDAFLNILICGRLDQTLQMIIRDGLLLSNLPTRQDGMV
ncbi:uncharacterized protein LOC134244719 [Saccostrea cucullata]|uniref:uncharacterized protein LOC134244719 n=1 Tax=Saccostrea cuccullata TaxID=36930 RepID=UPI002ED5A383